MNAYFHTLGCKVNQYETQAMMAAMTAAGYPAAAYAVGDGDIGDAVLVVNSCTVTGESDRKLRQLLRRLRRDCPQAVLVLTGCMPQAFPDKAEGLPQPDILLGNAARRLLPERVEDFLLHGQRIVDIPPHGAVFEPMSIDRFEGRTRAFVKIEDGCNRFCSYCIIPYARGRVRSKPLPDLLAECETLAGAGYTEIVLVGINLTAYGQEFGMTLADAAEAASKPAGVRRVRLGSLEPDCFDDRLIDRLAAIPKLCPQFHPALQSGCDATLRRMNRHYTTAQYAAVCQKLRAAFPDCALTTDMMVGFPGETEAEFAQSLAFAEEIGFSKIHVFPYSRREGTPAAKATAQVTQAEKAARAHRLTEAAERSRLARLREQVGRTVCVLTETRAADGTAGYTAGYDPARLNGAFPPGRMVTATVTGVADGELLCEPLDEVDYVQ